MTQKKTLEKEFARKSLFRQNLLFFVGGITVGILFCGILAYRHPADYGFPACPFHTATNLYCPGCGSLRATHFLLRGHLIDSVRCNPLVLSMLPLIIFSATRCFFAAFLQIRLPFPYQNVVYWAVLVVIVLFFIVRNLPFEFFEILRPPTLAIVENAFGVGFKFHFGRA
ncbi:MAG: DUF2752 domain-containing protein [Planctomycetaceae bacterium]|jgi:magnesium-transporting ATPase (P-type)|nr:DUF2752 domain-containing protein [Planctomycetaceae bacterium]